MKVTVNGINVYYIDEGEGENILLLHGWGANIQTMIPIHNILKNNARVIVLDLPGFGESELPKEPWNSYDYADFVKKFIDKLNINRIILFGHSHGGRISIILASQYRDLIKKVILIDSAGIKPKRNLKYYIKIYSFKFLKKLYILFTQGKDKKDKLEKFYKKFGSTDYKESEGVMRQTMVKVINDDLKKLLKDIKVPTLLIWGDKDEETPLYMGKIMEREIQDSGLVVLENAGHYSYVDSFGKFKAVIESFLKEDFI